MEDESYLDAVVGATKLNEESLELVNLVFKPHCQRNDRWISCLLVSPLLWIGRTYRLETQCTSWLKWSRVWVENYRSSTSTQIPFIGHGPTNDPALIYINSLKAFCMTDSSLTGHWDGKLIDSLDGRMEIERLLILVKKKGVVSFSGPLKTPWKKSSLSSCN